MAPFEAVPTSRADHLSEDHPIPGQNFVAVSFVDPEQVIVRKDAYATMRFMESRASELQEMLVELETKSEDAAKLAAAFRERHGGWLSCGDTAAAYEAFLADNQEDINRKYSELHGGVCCTRGVKVRGVYDTIEGARGRCQVLRSQDPIHDVFVMSVGKWCPWNPSAQSLEQVEYAEAELNGIMKGYRENTQSRAMEFADSTQVRIAAAKNDGAKGALSAAIEAKAAIEARADEPPADAPVDTAMFEESGDAHAEASKASTSKKPAAKPPLAAKKPPAARKPAAAKKSHTSAEPVTADPVPAREPAAPEPAAPEPAAPEPAVPEPGAAKKKPSRKAAAKK